MSKHTPGPWRLDRHSVLIPIAPYEWAEAYGGSEANARLIAAAPDLLDALKRISEFRLQDFMGPCHMAMECVAVAKSDIAKAEGSA